MEDFMMVAVMIISWIILVAVSYKGALIILKRADEL
jgi:hypothetical protein